MNIFSGRPGLLAGIICVICVILTAFTVPALIISLIITALLGAVFSLVLLGTRVIKPYRCFAALILIAITVVSLIRGMGFFDALSSEAEKLCGEDMRVHATVTERITSSDYYTVYTVKLHSVEGVDTSLIASLECQYNSELQEGYEFVLRGATVTSVWDADERARNSLISENVLLIIENESYEDCVIISEGNLTLRSRIRRVNSYLSAILTNGIGGEEGRLAAAMLFGNRELLDAEVKRDFARAGLSHYLAVSGMHVSLLTSLFGIVLAKLRIARRFKNLIMALFAAGYLTLLGFPVSATRSVVMLLIVFIAYFAGDDSDALNSLGIAASVILISTPYAIFDGSFILSYCATLGIVTFMPAGEKVLNRLLNRKKKEDSEKVNKEEKKFLRIWDTIASILKKLCRILYEAVFGVFSALSLTLLPTSIMFSKVSVVGVLSNIPAMLVASPLLAFSALFVIFGRVPYLGDFIKTATAYFARAFIDFAEFFSDFQGAVLSLSSRGAKIVTVVFTLILLLIITLKFKKKALCSFAPLLYPLAIAALFLILPHTYSEAPALTVVSTGKDESFLISFEDKAVLIDASDGSYSRIKSVTELACESSATEIEALILTHYHSKHIYSVTRLMSEEILRNLFLPMPQNEDDAAVMYALISASEEHGCNSYLIENGKSISLPGGLIGEFSQIQRLERSNHPAFLFKVSSDSTLLLFVSESAWESEALSDSLNVAMADSDILLLSSHGPAAKTEFRLNPQNACEIIVFNEELTPFLILPDRFLSDGGDRELIVGAETRIYKFGG